MMKRSIFRAAYAGQTHDFCSEFSVLLRSTPPSASSGLFVQMKSAEYRSTALLHQGAKKTMIATI